MRVDPKRKKMEGIWLLHWYPFLQPASEHITDDVTNDRFKLKSSIVASLTRSCSRKQK